ncbi:hypothetical protein GGF46_000491 [Coemansia sp. RSA 552]|nr:hypothetical protein GGF46_000491 [Coemansia sp. RSA 552]
MYKVADPGIKYTVAAEVGENVHGLQVVGEYTVLRKVGEGAFGKVYDVKCTSTGEHFAMKEYSKASLRRRRQTDGMRSARGRGIMMPRGRGAGRGGLFAARRVAMQRQQEEEASDPFSLIKAELAVSKKLLHPNVVRLYEVMNDDEQDILYLVIDLCQRGPVQKLDTVTWRSEPLDADAAHQYFVQALLGLEYLHGNDIIHRDLKPDNLLLTSDNVLKIADFGESTVVLGDDDKITGFTGTPAFTAPELCQGTHEVSGEATDIWSLGVCLYSFIYGMLPFEGSSVFEVLDAISQDDLSFPGPCDEQLRDLIGRMLDRSPDTRIAIPEIRQHPWVTRNGQFHLPTKEDNCANVVGPITQDDMDNTIKHIYDIMPVILAIAKLRRFRRHIKRDNKSNTAEPNQD